VLELQASTTRQPRLDAPYRQIPVDQCKIERIAQERRPYVGALEIEAALDSAEQETKTQSSLTLAGSPLASKERVLGVIAVLTRQSLSQVTLEKLAAIADTLVLGLERIRAQEALKDREQRWQTIAESLPQLVWTCHMLGEADYLSQHWTLYSGVPVAELLGSGWQKFSILMKPSACPRNGWQRYNRATGMNQSIVSAPAMASIAGSKHGASPLRPDL
jgi:PAS domain-containing protein